MKKDTDSLPRINLDLLIWGLQATSQHATYEDVRLFLIHKQKEKNLTRSEFDRKGFTQRSHLKHIDDYTYWTNSRDVIWELMRLGYLKKVPIPRKRSQLDVMRNIKYEPTVKGESSGNKAFNNREKIEDLVIVDMIRYHKYLQQFLKIISEKDLVLPNSINASILSGVELDPQIASEIVSAKALELFSLFGFPSVIEYEPLQQKLENYFQRRIEKRGEKGFANKELNNLIVDGLTGVYINAYGLKFDTVTFEMIVKLFTDVFLINSSFQIKNSPGQVIYPIAEWNIPEAGDWRIKRHGHKLFVSKIYSEIPKVFKYIKGNTPFVPIHEIRAEVCYRLKIADLLFNKVLTDLADGEYNGRYYVNLDLGGAGTLPPSVIPFTWRDRSYYLMTIITKDQ